MRLENWSIRNYLWQHVFVPIDSQYPKRAIGNVYGHPTKEDGKRVVTSEIIKIEGDVVFTKSGSQYQLGKMYDKYKEWLSLKDNRGRDE